MITQSGLFFIPVAVFSLVVVRGWSIPSTSLPKWGEVLQVVLKSVRVCSMLGAAWLDFRVAGDSFSQGAVQTCRELWLVQPSLELLVWQLCPREVHHRIILELFDFFAALLWELGVFGFVLWLVLPAPSWCCWSLCHGAVTSQDSAGVTTELLKHFLPSPPHLVAGELSLCRCGQIQTMEQSLCLEFVFSEFADKSFALCPRVTCGAERSLSASGGVEVGQWQDSRAPHVGFIAAGGGNVQLQVQK